MDRRKCIMGLLSLPFAEPTLADDKIVLWNYHSGHYVEMKYQLIHLTKKYEFVKFEKQDGQKIFVPLAQLDNKFDNVRAETINRFFEQNQEEIVDKIYVYFIIDAENKYNCLVTSEQLKLCDGTK